LQMCWTTGFHSTTEEDLRHWIQFCKKAIERGAEPKTPQYRPAIMRRWEKNFARSKTHSSAKILAPTWRWLINPSTFAKSAGVSRTRRSCSASPSRSSHWRNDLGDRQARIPWWLCANLANPAGLPLPSSAAHPLTQRSSRASFENRRLLS